MTPLSTYATITGGIITWRCHYCRRPIHTFGSGGVAAVRHADIRARLSCSGAPETPRARWYVVHKEHEGPLMRQWRWENDEEAEEAVPTSWDGTYDVEPDTYDIPLERLLTPDAVARLTFDVIRPREWLLVTDWLDVIAGPVGVKVDPEDLSTRRGPAT